MFLSSGCLGRSHVVCMRYAFPQAHVASTFSGIPGFCRCGFPELFFLSFFSCLCNYLTSIFFVLGLENTALLLVPQRPVAPSQFPPIFLVPLRVYPRSSHAKSFVVGLYLPHRFLPSLSSLFFSLLNSDPRPPWPVSTSHRRFSLSLCVTLLFFFATSTFFFSFFFPPTNFRRRLYDDRILSSQASFMPVKLELVLTSSAAPFPPFPLKLLLRSD